MADKPMTAGDVIEILNKFHKDTPVMRWVSYAFYAPICAIEQVTFDEWRDNQDESDQQLVEAMEDQGLTKENFPFIEITFLDAFY